MRFLLTAICMAVVVSLGLAGERDELFEFVANDGAATKISVDCERRATQPVSRLLYGKFTEHLGRNIYRGMWAQLIRNSGFEPADLWGRPGDRRRAPLAQRFATPEQASWIAQGLPPAWAKYGTDKIDYANDPDAFNSRQCLRMRFSGSAASVAGVRQPLDLPTHRQTDYEFSLHARADQDTELTIRLVGRTDAKLVAEMTVPVSAGAWQERHGRLRLPQLDTPRATECWLEIGLSKPCTLWLDQCMLFPIDHLDGWDIDVVQLVKQSELPILRWPGGNFVSDYHWKDGIGPVHDRPTRFNRAWNMPEPNHVGTDEFMRFCDLVGCQPMICINAGDGTPQEAADWVEYCTGSVDTTLGKLRAKNGHPEPYDVRYWEIGNELYGNWQNGHCTADEYAERYRMFVEAMRQRDPNIRFIANGHDLDWNRSLVQRCPDILRSVSLHTLIGGGMPVNTEPEKVWWSLAGFPWEYRHQLRQLSDQLRQRVPNGKLAITELQIFTNRPNLPNNSGVAEALFWAGTVNTAARAGDRVEMITHSALLNHGGGLRKRRGVVYPNPVFLARKLYSTQPGRWPVAVRVEGASFSASRLHNLPEVHQAPLLDVLALMSDADDELVLLVTNRHAHDPLDAKVKLAGFAPAGEATCQWLAGDGIMSVNSLENPRAVELQQRTIRLAGPHFSVTFPPRSLSVITLSNSKIKL